jgi:hypothetical protein
MRWLENNQIRLLEKAEAVWMREFTLAPAHVSGTRDGQLAFDVCLLDRTLRNLSFGGATLGSTEPSGLPKLKPGKYRLIAVAIPIEDDKPTSG